jgi:hypothetical protein
MSGLIYLVSPMVLGGMFLAYAIGNVPGLQRPSGAQDLPLLDLVPVGAVRCAAGRPLLQVLMARLLFLTALALLLAGCDSKPQFANADLTEADLWRGISR